MKPTRKYMVVPGTYTLPTGMKVSLAQTLSDAELDVLHRRHPALRPYLVLAAKETKAPEPETPTAETPAEAEE